MVIKTNLIFRECKGYTSKDGESKLRVRFLDDEDRSYTFFFSDDASHEKYKTMKKDTRVDLELVLFESPKNGRYGMIMR